MVAWKEKTADVYVVTRSLGDRMKASIHETGRCHVRLTDPESWRSPGSPPRFLDVWAIDPATLVSYPFGICIPESELRVGDWQQHRDRGTVWLPAWKGFSTEIAVFLARSLEDPRPSLTAAGWEYVLVDAPLPDGRRLLVVAGWSADQVVGSQDIVSFRAQAAPLVASAAQPSSNLRGVLLATDEKGTRRFVEVAVLPE
jgi:hypothetical protein